MPGLFCQVHTNRRHVGKRPTALPLYLAVIYRSLTRMLIPRRHNSSKLALLPLLCVLASCVTPDAGRRAENATRAEALLAEARQAKDPAAQIGCALAAADSAARNLSSGDARLTYNAACVELAARVGKSTGGISLPATSRSRREPPTRFNTSHRPGPGILRCSRSCFRPMR